MTMAILSLLTTTSPTTLLLTLLILALLPLPLYRLHLHPLASIPGPLLCRLTSLWTYYHSYTGDEATLITHFHKTYGPVVRIAPNEICIADGTCLAPIYSERGGFAKASCYRNFDIDGFASLFSEVFGAVRAPKAKSVAPLFSTGNLRQGEEVIGGVVGRFVERLRGERERVVRKGGKCDVLNLCRSFAVDAVTGYLFGRSYCSLDEGVVGGDDGKAGEGGEKAQMSASEFVDAFVGVGRFFYLPNWIFVAVELACERFFGTEKTEESMNKVDSFVRGVVSAADPDDGTYPGRMLKAGLTSDEVVAQCKDLMFAGTDSSGMNLSTLCWQLARNPDVYSKLKKEIAKASSETDPATLPYLRATVREALRLSMANPTRLPRVVPPSGWTYHCPSVSKTFYFPPNTVVSAQIQTLHHNPAVFKDPLVFNPERWLENGSTDKGAMELMNRDFIPFGLGSRQCIARNLAMMELTLAGKAIVEDGVLEGAQAVGDKVEIMEWFNSRVKGEEILLRWEKA